MFQGRSSQQALEGQDLSRAYRAHHDLESIFFLYIFIASGSQESVWFVYLSLAGGAALIEVFVETERQTAFSRDHQAWLEVWTDDGSLPVSAHHYQRHVATDG